MPGATAAAEKLPDYFVTADDITPREHVDIQAASQKWIDSSISKTANVPTDYQYEDFKDIYLYAHEKGLKGCTTFRFNPEAFQGVLVKEEDLKNTTYVFTLEDGTEIEAKGDEQIEYDGETHIGRESVRRPQGRLLRQVLTGRPAPRARVTARSSIDERTQDRQEDRQVPGREAGREGRSGSEGEGAGRRRAEPERHLDAREARASGGC